MLYFATAPFISGKNQARAYAALVGGSEAGLSYLFGGIGKLGGKVTGNVISKLVDKVDNILGKVAIKLGGEVLSEVAEEDLQAILTPWYKELTTNIEQEKPGWEEIAYNSLLTAVTTLLLQSGDTVKGVKAPVDAGKAAKTGWDIQVSGKVFAESQHLAKKNLTAIQYLPYINDIVKNAVLLDSYAMDSGKTKSPNSLLMHSMYTVADIGKGPEVLKLYVEEMNDPNKSTTVKRAYQLQNIEKASAVNGGVQGGTSSSLANTANAVHTVADLFAAVKAKDAAFQPKSAEKTTNRKVGWDGREVVTEAKGKSVTIDGVKYEFLGYDANGSPVYQDAEVLAEQSKQTEESRNEDTELRQDAEDGILKTPGELGEKAVPYSERGIEIEPRITEYLSELQNNADYIERKTGEINAQDLAILTTETGVEFTVVTVDGKDYLIRGDEKSTTIPSELVDIILNKKGTIACHSHPFIGDLMPSESDLEFLKRLTWQTESVIVDPTQQAVRFTMEGPVEVYNLSNTNDGDFYNSFFGGGE